MSGASVTPVHDWNASDAARTAPRAGFLSRLGLPPKLSARKALKEAAAHRLPAGERPRFRNLAEGLAARASSGPPDLWVIETGGPNALTCRLERPVVAVTRSLLDEYTRTEIEAVVAHCLVRSRVAGRKGVAVGYDDDVRAVALTRFPPALVAALRKAEPYTGRYGAFYLVADGATHRPVADRVAALLDL
ncbi:MAG TPA: hypothetical protein VG929_00520 [Actinomycetota bacterium]|nr:hypothetical protein [Actinomycetota bacterium]